MNFVFGDQDVAEFSSPLGEGGGVYIRLYRTSTYFDVQLLCIFLFQHRF